MTPAAPNPAAEALAAAAAAFLRGHPPFDAMEGEALRFLTQRLALAYFPANTPIFAPGDGRPRHCFVVQRGRVRRTDGDPAAGAPAAMLDAGECFPIGPLVEDVPGDASYTAVADTFCYQLPAADFRELLQRSPRFHDFATRHLATLLRESRRLLALRAAGSAWEQQAMNRPLRSLVQRAPVTCTPDAPTGAALRMMAEARTGSILVVDRGGRLAGILTRHDVLDRIALARRDLEAPVRDVMTPDPKTLPAEASAYDAALVIAREGIRHVPVMEGGALLGVVTERDLFALQRASVRGIHQAIAGAAATAELAHAAREIRRLARDLLAQGLAAEQLTTIVSTLNDALTARILELEQARHALDGIAWCWLAFGSEGRLEQTVSTDQDNGIVFADAAEQAPEAVRARLLPFAQAVNRALDACGFPLCEGNIMAGNPECCLSLSEWRRRFAGWIDTPTGGPLLNAVIYFDFRPLHGRHELAAGLREALHQLVQARPVFLRALAAYALETEPPLGFISDFRTDDAPGAPGTIDLKKSGARLFVDAARVLALASAAPHTGTAQRLRLAGARRGMTPEEIAAATEAFFFIQGLRLRAQLLSGADAAPAAPNRIDPAKLNEVDRRVLKESFHQAQKLQRRLALDFQL